MKGRARPNPVRKLTVAAAEVAVGSPIADWAGRCYEVSCALVEAKLVDGEAVYGHWRGPIAPGSYFAGRAGTPFVRHGWVVQRGGRVVDPTRFVFTGDAPGIYCGPSGSEYDEGGNEWLGRTRQPFPEDDGSKMVELSPTVLPSRAWGAVEKLVGDAAAEQTPGWFTQRQLHWIACAPYAALGGHAQEVYAALSAVGCGGFVPFDNRKRAEREARWAMEAAK